MSAAVPAAPVLGYLPAEPVVRPAVACGVQPSLLSPRPSRWAGSPYGADWRASQASLLAPVAPMPPVLPQQTATFGIAPATAVPWPPPPLPPCELSYRIESLESKKDQRIGNTDLVQQIELLRQDLEAVEAARQSDRNTYNKLRAKHLELIAERDQRIRLLEEQLEDFRSNISSVEDLKSQLLAAEERNLQLSRDFEQMKKVKYNMEEECTDLRSTVQQERQRADLLQSEIQSLRLQSQQPPAVTVQTRYEAVREQLPSAPGMQGGFLQDGMITVDLKEVDDAYDIDISDSDANYAAGRALGFEQRTQYGNYTDRPPVMETLQYSIARE